MEYTFYFNDNHFHDWRGYGIYLHDGIYEGIKRINEEKPKIHFSSVTDTEILSIKRSTIEEKKVEQLTNADYKIRGKIVAGYKQLRPNKDNKFLIIVVDCGFLLRVDAWAIPWSYGEERKQHTDYPVEPLRKDFSLNLKYGDFIEFRCLLKGEIYYDRPGSMVAGLEGTIQNIRLLSYKLGAFITVDDLTGEIVNSPSKSLDNGISEKSPDFNIAVPPNISEHKRRRASDTRGP